MKTNSLSYSRREFLKRTSRAASGFVLLSSIPSFLRSGTLTGVPLSTERAFFTMGTTVTISAYGESRDQINHAVTKAFQAIQRCDNLMSLYKPESDLCRLNRSGGRETVCIDESLVEILHQAKHFHDLSYGAFDVTIEPLMQLWGFRSEMGEPLHPPTDKEIAVTLDAVGFENIFVENEKEVGLLHPDAKVDLGGIAVGYSVDAAVNVLRREGIESAFINHSGDAYALGAPPECEGWEIGIPNPLNTHELVSNFSVRDKAISTSGNYEKTVKIHGRPFGHILDPRTGKPGDATLSTTLIADTAITADALSTGMFCLDEDQQAALVNRVRGLELIRIKGDKASPEISHWGRG
ncbi:MAG: FAD:protein FMN transferase [Bacteroidota bacterium]